MHKSLPDRTVFRRSPEAEAGHATAGEQTHTADTKKGVGQNRVDFDPEQLKREMEKVNDPAVQAAWQKVLANLITFSAERCEHQKPVAGKGPAFQGRRRDVDLCAFHSDTAENRHTEALHCHLFPSYQTLWGQRAEIKGPKVEEQNPSLTIRSYLWSLCC